MTRRLRVYSGSDQSPVIDYTDVTNWEESELAGAANNGESGVGRIVIFDEAGVIPDYVGSGQFLNSHNVVLVEDGPYTLFRGRIGTRERSRHDRRGPRTVAWDITTGDYNTDLRGIVIDPAQYTAVRPSETDVARVHAIIAMSLRGTPRATTVLNGSNYVSGSNTVSLAAKTYSGVTPQDILSEIATTAGKVFFVTVDGEVFYDGTESTAYASTLRISDDPADANATTYAPQWDSGSPATEDGIEQLTALRSYYGTSSSVRVTNTLGVQTDYWEGLFWDDLATSASASTRATKRLEELSQDILTYTCTIGPIPWAQLGSIKHGQTISFKARAARGGRSGAGAYTGDSFITVRIAELRWKMPAPDTYLATLRLIKPPKITGSGTGSKPLVYAQEALTSTGSVADASLTLGSDAMFDNATMCESDGVLGSWSTTVANFVPKSGCGPGHTDGSYPGECNSVGQVRRYGQEVYRSAFMAHIPANSGYLGFELSMVLRSYQHAQTNDCGANLGYGGAGGVDSPVLGPHSVSGGFATGTPSNAHLSSGVSLGTSSGDNSGDRTVKFFVPSNLVTYSTDHIFYVQPGFRMSLLSSCTYIFGAGGDGSIKIGNATLKPITIASAGMVSGGLLGTQNGVNTSFTLVGSDTRVENVWRNAILLPHDAWTYSAGTLTTDGWAPSATDIITVRYEVT